MGASDQKLISVIVPTRNRAHLAVQALRSVMAQTWSNIEVIIVDDASEDDTRSVISRTLPNLKIICHTNAKGPGAARNTGVSASNGEYILFLDDDDLLHPTHVKSLVHAIDDLPSGNAVSGRWRRVEEVAAGQFRFGPVMCASSEYDDAATLVDLLEPLGEGTIWTSSVLWPRRVVGEVKWDEELFTNGDVDFFGRAVLSGCKIYGRPVGMAYYRIHGGERVAGTVSERGLISSTRYRLKWSKMLRCGPYCEQVSVPMRNGFMSLIILWSQLKGGSNWLPVLEKEYRIWGGRGYFIPNPPRSPIKRVISKLALRFGGTRALACVLELGHLARRSQQQRFSLSLEDAKDAQVVASCL